jgi:nicotinamidase-related amidase
MPLLERADCLLVIVDAQPGFVAHPSMSATEHEQSAAALGHAAWLAGLARLLDVPAVVVEEGVERNDATDETLRARLPPSTPGYREDHLQLGGAAGGSVGDPCDTSLDRRAGRFRDRHVVAQSAIELRDLGFRVAVPEDATCSTGTAEHRRGLDRMRQAGVEI